MATDDFEVHGVRQAASEECHETDQRCPLELERGRRDESDDVFEQIEQVLE